MKKIYKLEGLCCANCAAKIEREIKETDGVDELSLSFMTSKLILQVKDDKVEPVEQAVKTIVHKIEPSVSVLCVR